MRHPGDPQVEFSHESILMESDDIKYDAHSPIFIYLKFLNIENLININIKEDAFNYSFA